MYTEEEQLAALQLWWERWRWVVVATVVSGCLTAGGYIGWDAWGSSREQQNRAAYDAVAESLQKVQEVRILRRQKQLESLAEEGNSEPDDGTAEDDTAERAQWDETEMLALQEAVAASEEMMRQRASSGYSWLAALQTAAISEGNDAPQMRQAALSLMQQVLDASDSFLSGDDVFHGLVRLRYARLLAEEGEVQRALELLEDERVQAYELLYQDLKGDLLAEQGNLSAARIAWENAKSGELPPLMSALLEVKINSWGLIDPQQGGDAPAELPADK